MTNRTAMTDIDARALHAMQRGPAAYHCPTGHGPLRVWPEADSPSGHCLVCTACGHRITADAALIELATGNATTTDVEPEPASIVQLTDGAAPRGLRPDGSVRTTGCVQFGKVPMSSGLWVALASFLATVPLIPAIPWMPIVATPLGYLIWKLCTTRWLPASLAVNIRWTPAAELAVGQHIRLYGTAGPVGEVSSVSADALGRIRLRMIGDREFLYQPGQQVWRVELQN